MPRTALALNILAATLISTPLASAADTAYAIRNVTLIDVKQGRALPHRTVIIHNDKILNIFDAPEGRPASSPPTPDARPIPPNTTSIDGTNLFLIPGLTDAHVHYVDPEGFGRLLIANGVTLVRETGNETSRVIDIRDRLNNGSLAGPQMICTGAIVDGVPPVWPFSEACDTPDEGRAAVQRLHAAGVNQIKVYSRLKPDVYAAVVDEARTLGLKATGHIPGVCDIDDAIAAGQACNEHFMAFEKLIAKLSPAEIPAEVLKQAGIYAGMSAWGRMATVDRAALQAELKKVAAAGMYQCPTIVVMAGIGSTAAGPHQQAGATNKPDPRLAYIPASLRSFWDSPNYQGGFATFAHAAVAPMQSMALECHKAGVPLMIGTDLANPFVYPGFSVHDEMKLFADAGIPNADVLRSATITPATFFGLDASLGSIEIGKTASLVLLSANPLDDIANTTKITGVFNRGKYHDRKALDQLLAEAKTLAASDALGAAAAGDEDGVKLELPGETVARGRYKMKFGNFDAGVEDFLITKTADGLHLIAHNQPKGGMQPPVLLTLHLNPDRSFKSASYKQLADNPVEAKYELRDNTLHATGTRKGQPLEPQALPLPGDASIGTPVYISDFMTLGTLNLKAGEERKLSSVYFGYPDWRWSASPITIKREPDATLKRPDGKEVTAQFYTSALTTPVGVFKGQTWTDANYVVLKGVLVMPFGTITFELE